MRNLDDNTLYRYLILLIVYSYILACDILSQGILSTIKGAAMAEPPLYPWKRSIIIPFVTVKTWRLHDKVEVDGA
jgi:hypothetical protein